MRVAVLGAGGHARVVADAILASGTDELFGFFDDDPSLWGNAHFGRPVLGPLDSWQDHAVDAIVVGIGDNRARKLQFERIKAAGARPATIAHPRATLARGVLLEEGAVVLANAVVNSDTRIGANSILNTACSVDHDCVVGAHAHLAPGVTIAGEVRLGEGVFVGIGAVIAPRISVGSWTCIGAGAVVIRDAAAGLTLVGVPAKAI